MKHWIPCQPTDRAASTMMRFILETSQAVKTYTAQRIYLGDRRGSNKPVENLMNEWLNDYMRLHRIAADVPRYAVRDAMEEVLTNGIKTWPEERADWNGFSVQPRKGWKGEEEKEEAISWEEYIRGKRKRVVKEGDRRSVIPDMAVRSLMEKGIVGFKWGRVLLRGAYENKLGVQAAQHGIGKEEFLKHVKKMDFVRLTSDSDWKVNFTLE